jgi:hypothetical protein
MGKPRLIIEDEHGNEEIFDLVQPIEEAIEICEEVEESDQPPVHPKQEEQMRREAIERLFSSRGTYI